ncbi:hypothetical protein QBZ16_002919 [Prototheca wickerhamii]|uniref:Uncharacterized protein n=1 Tax=Prototheca wickerhamii TaxID=3111 RepID=A0AAD9IKJ0_PROWI|nr:hypothetical protein QBZ16_002919 [Prototheca wickerhamii]
MGSEALERFGLLNVQWQQLEMELRLLLRHYQVHPISVNQSNAAVLPIMLSSKPLPEMEAQETTLAAELYQTAGLEGLPQEQQLARLMELSESLNGLITGLTKEGGALHPKSDARLAWQREVQARTARAAPPVAGPPVSGTKLEGPQLLRAAAAYGYGLS